MAETDNNFDDLNQPQQDQPADEPASPPEADGGADEEFDFSKLIESEAEEVEPVNPLENGGEQTDEAGDADAEESAEESSLEEMPSTPDFSGMAMDSAKESLASASEGPPPVDLSQWTGSIETSGKVGEPARMSTESPQEPADEPAPEPVEPADEPVDDSLNMPSSSAPEAMAQPPVKETPVQPELAEEDMTMASASSGAAAAAMHADQEESPPGLYDQISSSKFNEDLTPPELSETIGAAAATAVSRRTVREADLKGKAEELFRGMWASIFYSGRMTGNAAVICAPSRHEGATTIACGLAVAGSGPAGGERVCLVDLNLRAPAVHDVLHLKQSPGLIDVLAGKQELHTVIQGVNESLDVITVGTTGARSLDVLRSDALEQLFDMLHDAYDYILVDTAAANHYPDAQVLAGVVGDVVLVTHADQTPREAVAQAKKRIEAGGGKIAGLVLNQRSFPIPTFLYRRV